VPTELGGSGGRGRPRGTVCSGYAACFQSGLAALRVGAQLDLSGSANHGAASGSGSYGSGGLGLAAALDLDAPQISRAAAPS